MNIWSLQRKYCIILLLLSFLVFEYILWKRTKWTKKPIRRPWYLTNGTRVPEPANISEEHGWRIAELMPEENPNSDRFENQLMFVPPNYEEIRQSKETKKIVIYNGLEGWWGVGHMNTMFADKGCPVSTCTFSDKREDAESADFILFSGQHEPIKLERSPHQVYGFYRLESPVHWNAPFTPSIIYNWTVTYRHDSTVPIPYSRWMYFDPETKQKPQNQNYAAAANKTKKVAWLVSNCEAHNDRLIYGQELQKYIQVDIYGACGTKNCSQDTYQCLDMIEKDYKFYLAFENSHCVDYITEKVFRNSLRRNIIPVVLGARRQDYERQMPLGSFIYVEDFESPKKLAEYLHRVDKDDDLYNSYFKYKGTGEIHSPFSLLWCRICALLHDDYSMQPRWYDDINAWWFNTSTWRRGFWRDTE